MFQIFHIWVKGMIWFITHMFNRVITKIAVSLIFSCKSDIFFLVVCTKSPMLPKDKRGKFSMVIMNAV